MSEAREGLARPLDPVLVNQARMCRMHPGAAHQTSRRGIWVSVTQCAVLDMRVVLPRVKRSGILTAGAVRLPLCLSGPCRHSPFADKMSDGAGPDGPRTRKPMEYNQTDLAAFGAVQLGTWRSDEWLSTAGALLALSTRADLLPSNRAEADGIRRHLANWCRLI